MKPEDRPYGELGATFSRAAIGAPVTDTQVEILRMLFSPRRRDCAAALDFVPEPEEIIATRAGMDPDVAADLLTRMASRGLIRGVRRPDGVRVFRLLLFFPGLIEMALINPSPSVDWEKLGALYDEYYREGWGRVMHGTRCSLSPRAAAHRSAEGAGPGLRGCARAHRERLGRDALCNAPVASPFTPAIARETYALGSARG